MDGAISGAEGSLWKLFSSFQSDLSRGKQSPDTQDIIHGLLAMEAITSTFVNLFQMTWTHLFVNKFALWYQTEESSLGNEPMNHVTITYNYKLHVTHGCLLFIETWKGVGWGRLSLRLTPLSLRLRPRRLFFRKRSLATSTFNVIYFLLCFVLPSCYPSSSVSRRRPEAKSL